jgi:adenosylmethionine---8-amino-7-oxononanoate aminotransferase
MPKCRSRRPPTRKPCTDVMTGSANADWLARSQAAVWHPCTQMQHHARTGAPTHLPLIPIARGDGAWLYDFDGKRYLDGISSWWTNLFGHANPRINAALKAQLETLEHVMLAGFTHQPVVELSERLSSLTGGRLGHAFYASDGASATEIALKMSFHAWRNRGRPEKREFLCLAGSYHGETVGALAVTDVALFRDAYAPLVRAATVMPSPDARLAEAGETAADVARRAAAALEKHLAAHSETIAALIVEPLVQGAGGMAMYDPEYLVLARQLCDRYEVHLICDEIAVGFGRTGSFFAHEQATIAGQPIRPDLLCMSKGISGGYLPLSVVLASDAIYDAFLDDSVARAFLHSHSYTGNPLACRAALATLDIFEQDDVLTVNRQKATKISAALAPLAEHPQVRHLRQRGMIAAFDVATDDPYFSRSFYRAALAREVLIRPIGNTVYLMPPYIISEAEIDHLADAIRQSIQVC